MSNEKGPVGYKGWIGVDLDGSLAHYESRGPGGRSMESQVGTPLWPMVERIKGWLAEEREVRIMTARVCVSMNSPQEIQKEIALLHKWLQEVCGLPPLAVTAEKDYLMLELWDDRAIQLEYNTGIPKFPNPSIR